MVRPHRGPARRRSTPRTPRCSRNFAAAYPSLFGLASDDELGLERYADELLELTDVAHVSDAHGLLGEGLPYGTGELDLDPVVRRLGERVPYIVAEINEPDPARSEDMKAGYRAIERALAAPRGAAARRPPPAPASTRSTGRPWSAAATRCRPCSSCRSASAAAAC